MKTKHFIKSACKWLLIAAVLISAILVLQTKKVNYEDINQYTTSDVKYANGSTAHFEDKNFGIVNKNDVVTLRIELPERHFFVNSSLVFYDFNAVTKVWFGENLLTSYGEDIDEKGLMIGNHDFIIAVPDDAWGDEITIELRATENRAFSNFTNLRIYPAENVYQFYTDNDPIGLVVALALLVFSLIGLFGLTFGNIRGLDLRRGLALSFTALLISLWMIANKGIYNVFGFNAYFWQPLEYIAGYAIPIPILLFYGSMAEIKAKWKKIFDIFAIISTAFVAVSLVLNYTNIAHFDALMDVAGVVLVLSALLMLSYIIALKSGEVGSNALLKTGMYFFVVTCIYEVLIRNLFRFIPLPFFHNLPSIISIGVLALFISMTVAFLSDMYEKKKKLLTVQVKTNTLVEIIDVTPAGIGQLIPDEQHTVVSANDIFYKILGYQDSDLEGQKPKTPFAHLSDSEKAFLRKKVDEILSGSEDRGEFELVITKSSQSIKTILIRYFYDRNGSGNITVSLLDISERKRMEDELRIRSKEYRLAIEASEHYYFNYDAVTKTCTHLFDSEELFGISEKIGNIPDSLVECGLCAPESIDDYCRAFRMFNDGVPRGDFVLHLQNVKTHVYRWYSGAYRTVFDLNGTPIRAVVAFKDITEQREKEIAYNIYKKKIESLPEDKINYFEIDLKTGICNYFYGTQAKQISKNTSINWNKMLECAVQNFVHQEDRMSISQFLNTKNLLTIHERGMKEAVHEYRGYVSDGSLRWLRVLVNIVSDENTQELRAYCLIEDIEEEKAKKLELQLERKRFQHFEDAYNKLASSVMYGVCKYNADDDLSIIFANDIFYQMHGYHSQKEAVAAGFTNILFTAPDFGKEQVRAAHREYIQGKINQIFETEYPTIDADGNRIWILCRGIYSPEDGIFNASVLNITDRKIAEEKLRVSEVQYRLALSQSGKVFFFFDIPARTMLLSDELAQAFGLPTKVDNMPDNFISQGLVEPQSVENYRHFYEEIYAGKPNGSTIISCHMRSAPEKVLWYRIDFTSVFNERGVPQSAIITYDDLQEERANKIAGAWKQLNLLSMPESKYEITEYNLTQNSLLRQGGGLFAMLPDFLKSYDEINKFVLEHFIYDEDVPAYKRFLDRERVLSMFEEGKTEDTIEYRSLQSGSTPRWTSTSIQMIKDSYSGDILAQLLFKDIHSEKSGQMEMKQNIEALRKELEDSRIKVMINQMQPHFLYNTLSAIQAIVTIDADYAYQLLYDFTIHLRSSIKALSSDSPIPFLTEMEYVKAYLNIEKMRFGEKIKINYSIECEDFSVILLSIRSLVENAVQHGLYPKGDEGGTIWIRSRESEDCYIVEVEDDGEGFNVQETFSQSNESTGLKNLIYRLKTLMNAEIDIISKIGTGTLARMIIPKICKGENTSENDSCGR